MWRKAVLAVPLVAISAIMLIVSFPASDAAETGEMEVGIPLDGILYSEDSLVIKLNLDEGEVPVIYDTDSSTEIAERLIVTHNGLQVSNFTLIGGGQSGNFTLSFDDVVINFHVDVTINKVERLIVESSGLKPFYWGASLSEVQFDFKNNTSIVKAIWTDGSVSVVDPWDITVSGSLSTDGGTATEAPSGEEGEFVIVELELTYNDGKGILPVTVKKDTPESISVSFDFTNQFYANDTVVFEEIEVGYASGNKVNILTTHASYNVTYNGVDSNDGGCLKGGRNVIVITYAENGETVSETITLNNVIKNSVTPPDLDVSTSEYSGKEIKHYFSNYDENLMEITTTGGALLKYDESLNQFYISVTDANEAYVITVELKDTDSYKWLGTDDDDESEPIVFSFVVNKTDYDEVVSIENIDGWEYGESPDEPYLDPESLPEGYRIDWHYSGTDRGGQSIADSSNLPVNAGNWKLYATISSNNYKTFDTEPVYFSILPYRVTPIPIQYEYSGETVDLNRTVTVEINDSYSSSYSVSGTDENPVNVGTYHAIAKLADVVNYIWVNGSSDEYHFEWEIVAAENSLSVSYDTGSWNYLATAEELKYDWSNGFKTDDYSVDVYKDSSLSNIAQKNIYGRYNVGTYYVKVTVPEITADVGDTEVTNVKGTFATTTFTILPQPISDLSILSQTYSETTPGTPDKHFAVLPEVPLEELNNEIAIKFTSNDGWTSQGKYDVVIATTENFIFDSTQSGVSPDRRTATLVFTIEKATDNEISFVEDLNKPSPTYGDDYSWKPEATATYISGATITYYYKVGTEWILWDNGPTDAGTYQIKAVVSSTDNFNGDDVEGLSFTINEKKISVLPSIKKSIIYTYTGEPITVDASKDVWDNWIDGAFDISNNTGTDADNYQLTLTVGNNYCWSEDISSGDSVLIDWVINKREIILTDSSDSGTRQVLIANPIPTFEFWNGISVDYTLEHSWNLNPVMNQTYSNTLIMTEEDFKNNSWGQSEFPGDSVGEKGKTLKIYYTVVGDKYSIYATFDTQFYVDGSLGHKYTGSTIDVKSFITSINKDGTIPDDDFESILDDVKLTYYSSDSEEPLEGAPTNAGSYRVLISLPAVGDYGATSCIYDFNIVPLNIKANVDLSNLVFVYDGTNQILKIPSTALRVVDENGTVLTTGVTWLYTIDGNAPVLPEAMTTFPVNADTYTVKYSVSAGINYGTNDGDFSLVVQPKPIDLNFVDSTLSSPYDGNIPDLSGVKWNPFKDDDVVNNDSVDVKLNFAAEDNTRNVGYHTIVATSSNTNYVLSIVGSSEYEVTAIEIKDDMFKLSLYEDINGNNKIYDAEYHNLISSTLKIWKPLNSEDEYVVVVTSENNRQKDANEYELNYEIRSDNYVTYIGKVNVTIDPAPISVTANSDSVVYGEAYVLNADEGVTISGIKESDKLCEVWNELFVLTTPYVQGFVNDFSYPIYVGLKQDVKIPSNYEVEEYVAGILTVTKRPITIKISDSSSTYGEDVVFDHEVTSDLKICTWDSDKVYSLSLPDYAKDVPDVDEYDIVVLPGDRWDFYDVSYDWGEADGAVHTINPAEISVSVTLPSSTYDGHEKVVSVELNGDLIGDDKDKKPIVQYRKSSDPDTSYNDNPPTNCGSYTFRIVMDGDVQNYDFQTTASTTFTISQALLTVSIVYDYTAPEYDGNKKNLRYEIQQITATGVDLNGDGKFGDVISGEDLKDYIAVKVGYRTGDSEDYDYTDSPINAGVYEAHVLITSINDNFSSPSGYTQPSYFEIDARDVTVVWSSQEDLTYTGIERPYSDWCRFETVDDSKEVALSSKVTIVDSKEFINADTYIFTVDLDTVTNYEIVSNATHIYTIDPAKIEIDVEGSFDGYTFGDLSRGNTILDKPYPKLTYSGVMADKFMADMGSNTWITFGIDTSKFGTDDYYGAYFTATDHVGVVALSYNGSSNYELEGGPFTLSIEPRAVKVTIEDQYRTYTGSPIDVDDDAYVLAEGSETLKQHLGISVIYGSNGVQNTGSIINYAADGYPLTLTWTNKNFSLIYNDSRLYVEQAGNHWINTDSFGVKGWVFGEYNTSENAIDYPDSYLGNVDAYLVYPDGKEIDVDTFDESDWNNLDANPTIPYHIKFVVDPTDNWEGLSDDTHVISFFVNQKKLVAQWVGDGMIDGGFSYDGSTHTVTLKLEGYEGNENIVSVSHYKDCEYTESNGVITMSAIESGEHGVVLTLDDDNYVWDQTIHEDSSEDYLVVIWEIRPLGANVWIEEPTITESWEYGETPNITYGLPQYGVDSVKKMFYYSSGAEVGDELPEDVGSYYVVIYVEESANWDRLEWKHDFFITKKSFTEPVVENKVFSYKNGEPVEYDLSVLPGYEEWITHVSVSGDSATDPGNYSLVLTITNPNNCQWVDGEGAISNEPVFIPWEISNAEALSEDMFTVDVSAASWTGHPIQKSVVATNLVEGEDFVVSYSNNTNATGGQQLAVITITGIGAYEGSTLSYSFEIKQAVTDVSFYNEELKMYIEDDSFLNAIRLPSFIGESSLQYASSNPDVATVDPTTGAITMNHVGTTTITVTVPGTSNYTAAEASYELTVSDTPVEVVDHVVYIRVPVTDPDDPDDPADDKPEEPAIVYKNDNTLYIILLLVLAVVCVCFAAYIMYTHRKQENQGGGQR